MKSKSTAALWCFLLGSLGAHKYYLGEKNLGILYSAIFILFCWTLIVPIMLGVVAVIEVIVLLTTSDDDFNAKYNNGESSARLSAKESASTLGVLKTLYDDGAITTEEYADKRAKIVKGL